MHPGPDGFDHRTGDEIGRDGRRRHTEQQHQHRRDDDCPAHSGESDEKPREQPADGQQ